MTTLTENTVVARGDAQVSTKVENETVLLQLSSGLYFSLNAVGSFVWDLLETPTTAQAIAQKLQDEYEVEQERAQADVLALLSQLVEAGFARQAPSQHES